MSYLIDTVFICENLDSMSRRPSGFGVTIIKYGTGPYRQPSARLPSALSCATAGGYAAWPSVLIPCGAGWFAPRERFDLNTMSCKQKSTKETRRPIDPCLSSLMLFWTAEEAEKFIEEFEIQAVSLVGFRWRGVSTATIRAPTAGRLQRCNTSDKKIVDKVIPTASGVLITDSARFPLACH